MSKLFKSKFLLGVMVVAVLVVAGAVSSASAQTTTTTTTVVAPAFTYSGVMRYGMSGPGIATLQAALNTVNSGGTIVVDGKFGPATLAAVKRFQMAKGLVADGVVGPITGAALAQATVTVITVGTNLPAGCTSTAGFSPTTGVRCDSGSSLPAGCTSTAGYSPTTGVKCSGGSTSTGGSTSGGLQGGAGSITIEGTSDFSGEEVGEGAEEAEVAGFEIEADEESDVEITSVKVEFYQSDTDSSQDFDDYAESVQILMNGEVVGSADADAFSENSDVWSKTISLDDAIVRSGDTEEFSVAVTALNNLDSGDIDDDNWYVGVSSVRFEDAEGVTTTESLTLDVDEAVVDDEVEQTFDFASFAAATDLDLQFSLTDDEDDINEAHVIDVDNTDDTENVELLAFTIEADGDSDVNISELSVTLTSTEAAGAHFDDVADIVTKVTLWMDGEEIASESTTDAGANDLEVVVFDDLDIDVGANDEVEIVVAVDLIDTDGVLDDGDTIKAEITTTNADATEAEDETGEELGTGDISGSALGEASTVLTTGMMAKFVSSTATATPSGVATVDDTGTFKIVFDVTAFDTDIYVDGSAITDESGGATYQDIDASTTSVATGVVECSGCDEAANDTFKVSEGQTERFTVTIAGSGADVFASASLESILYALTAVDGDLLYTYNMSDFETDSVWLDSN